MICRTHFFYFLPSESKTHFVRSFVILLRSGLLGVYNADGYGELFANDVALGLAVVHPAAAALCTKGTKASESQHTCNFARRRGFKMAATASVVEMWFACQHRRGSGAGCKLRLGFRLYSGHTPIMLTHASIVLSPPPYHANAMPLSC